MMQWRGRYRQWLLLPFILLFFYLAVSSMVDDSPTMDEHNHIGRGVGFLFSGDPRLSLEHPPLVNTLSVLPLLTMDALNIPYDHPSWELEPPDIYWYLFADQLVWQYDNDVSQMMFLARLPVVFMTLGLALVGFHFARLMWQRPLPAILTFIMLLFDPNVMANGRYVTTDLGGTLFLFLATLLLWRMWQSDRWDWQAWVWASVGMGLAFGSKLSTLVFVPIWAILTLLPIYQSQNFDLSFLRRQESMLLKMWIPAFAGMTNQSFVIDKWGVVLELPKLAQKQALTICYQTPTPYQHLPTPTPANPIYLIATCAT
ncbi:MAG: phospholipid carrier-dependent glycosyltransferase, partial [Chloroflexi bacterium]|nr:phospholipid carrier-dependent glycosyltransferase [Chloroflexota bacterium]